MTGATNANPLAAILGAGATAPGMANGGSFMVGGGYSAPTTTRWRCSRWRPASRWWSTATRQGRGGQVVNIDNRIIITRLGRCRHLEQAEGQPLSSRRSGCAPDGAGLIDGDRQHPPAGRGRAGRDRRAAVQDLDPDRAVGHRAAHRRMGCRALRIRHRLCGARQGRPAQRGDQAVAGPARAGLSVPLQGLVGLRGRPMSASAPATASIAAFQLVKILRH